MSAAQMPAPRVMKTLVARELSEFRLLFAYVPAMLATLCMLWFAVWIVRGMPSDLRALDQMRSEALPWLAPEVLAGFADTRADRRALSLYALFQALLLLGFWISMMFYCLSCLYRQRSDRSILFWNSMPVSSFQTVLSKLLAGFVAGHAIYFASLVALDLFIWVATESAIAFAPQGERLLRINDAAPLVRGPLSTAQPFVAVSAYLQGLVPALLWSLPAYAWLLLASAWSRQAPFAWAAGPWILAIFSEQMLSGGTEILHTAIEHLLPFVGLRRAGGEYPPLALAVSAVLGLVLVYAAVRCNRSDAN